MILELQKEEPDLFTPNKIEVYRSMLKRGDVYKRQPLYRYGFNQLLKLLSNDNYTLDVVTQYPEIIFDIKQFNYPRLHVIKSPKSHLGIASVSYTHLCC